MSFIFGGNTGLTYEQVQSRHRLADQLLSQNSQAPRNVGEGLSALGRALAARAINSRADRREEELSSEFGADFSSALGGGGSSTAARQTVPGSNTSALPASLIASESGGDYLATNDAMGSGGQGHFGRGQFSRGRLQDAERAGVIPVGTTPEQFRADPQMQQAVEAWHTSDIDGFIEQNNLGRFIGQNVNGTPVTRDGLVAVAHLGGNEGMRRFLESGGTYDPADENGTSLSAYLAQHAGPSSQTNPFRAGGQQQVQQALLQQTSQQASPNVSRIAELIQLGNNPMASPMHRQVIGAMLEREMARPDPMRQLQLERERLEIDRLRNPQSDVPSSVTALQMRAQMAGLQPGTEDYTQFMISGGRGPLVEVNNNQGDSVAIEEISKDAVEQSSAFIEVGQQAARSAIQIDELDRLLQTAPQGMAGRFASLANSMGLEVEGGDEVAAAEAIINQMVPAQRPPGSGPMSDADLDLFKRSLVRIINQPGGNAIIIQGMRALNEYDQARGQIATQYQQNIVNGMPQSQALQQFRQAISDLDSATPSLESLISGGSTAPTEQRQPGQDGIIDWTDL